jgi:hypothetical protein
MVFAGAICVARRKNSFFDLNIFWDGFDQDVSIPQRDLEIVGRQQPSDGGLGGFRRGADFPQIDVCQLAPFVGQFR